MGSQPENVFDNMTDEEYEKEVQEQTARYGKINIPCPCGTTFESERRRFHTCPLCQRVWDTRPDLPPYKKSFSEGT